MKERIPKAERLRGLQVQIMSFKERDEGKDYVSATVYVEQDSQKGIVIGRGGSALKRLGMAARADIEAFLGEPLPHDVEFCPFFRHAHFSSCLSGQDRQTTSS